MFKRKNKTKSNIPEPPPPPSLDDILSDLETFNVPSTHPVTRNSSSYTSNNNKSLKSLDAWWKQFEHVVHNNQQLTILLDELESYKTKLDTIRTELHTEADILRDDIENKRKLIDSALSEVNEQQQKMQLP